jgi:hypothetical protein
MEWSEPKMWRIETGQTALRALDVEAMCAAYHAPRGLTQALAQLARQAKVYGWWRSYDETVPGHCDIYATLQEAASSLLSYACCQVPDQLRTDAYARALFMRGNPDPANADRLVRDCLARQIQVMRADEPLPVTIILSETVVRRPVFGAEVLAEQLRHLAGVAALPNVCLRIAPLSAGMHPGLETGPFTLLEFASTAGAETDTAIVHSAGLTGELYLDKPHEVERYREAHAAILDCSLDKTATQDLLRAAANELEQ